MKFSGFSLVELVITTILLSILVGVLFQSYGYISRTAINLQAHTTIQKELLYVVETLQNDIDKSSISTTIQSGNLVWNQIIELQQQSGDMIRYFRQCDMKQKCGIVRQTAGTTILLTDPEKVHVALFDIGHMINGKAKGFWLHMDVQYSKNIGLGNRLQTFFTSR